MHDTVFFSTSTNIGFAPAWIIVFEVAINDMGLVITSSPGPIPNAFKVIKFPIVQLDTPTQYFAWT